LKTQTRPASEAWPRAPTTTVRYSRYRAFGAVSCAVSCVCWNASHLRPPLGLYGARSRQSRGRHCRHPRRSARLLSLPWGPSSSKYSASCRSRGSLTSAPQVALPEIEGEYDHVQNGRMANPLRRPLHPPAYRRNARRRLRSCPATDHAAAIWRVPDEMDFVL
jgi:hypothetical protein